MKSSLTIVAATAALWALVGSQSSVSRAQPPAADVTADAVAIVDGVVRQLFRSARRGDAELLLQIEVERSEGRKPLAGGRPIGFPGPGEMAYVHVSEASSAAPPEPREGSQVRVYLAPRSAGGWESLWMGPADNRQSEPASGAPVEDPSSAAMLRSRLGMTAEVLKVKNDQIGLRVISVERGGAAQEAGLEPGDVIAGVNATPLTTPEQLESLARRATPFSIIVVDVNTGRGVQVEVSPGTAPGEIANRGPETPMPKASLGVSAEPVTLGARSALKITRVDPAGPAAAAGLEPGDVIVAANGAPMTGPEQLLSALRKSGPLLKLTVRDARTNRDTVVEVPLSGEPTAEPAPAEFESPPAAAPGKLGAVTELAFNDDDFAVKVTEIDPRSPAARAGLRPGVLILAANGKPVLHPDELSDAVRSSGSALTLTILDPASGRRSEVKVDLRP